MDDSTSLNDMETRAADWRRVFALLAAAAADTGRAAAAAAKDVTDYRMLAGTRNEADAVALDEVREAWEKARSTARATQGWRASADSAEDWIASALETGEMGPIIDRVEADAAAGIDRTALDMETRLRHIADVLVTFQARG